MKLLQRAWIKGLPILGLIWLVAAVADRLWFSLDQAAPAWDQAGHLNTTLRFWQYLQSPQWSSGDWWTGLWMLTTKYPPLVYLSTVPFFNSFGKSYDQATLVNLAYSGILLIAVYGLGCRLFSPTVGWLAAALCLVMPGLYRIRVDFLLDYPLVAMVTLTLFALTLWRWLRFWPEEQPLSRWGRGQAWLGAIAWGLCLGLTMLVKQSCLLFLLVPVLWVGAESVVQRAWERLLQWGTGLLVAGLTILPWVRPNWLLILTSVEGSTIKPAMEEGDPSLLSLAAWTYYLQLLPKLATLPLLVVALLGLGLFWRRSRLRRQWREGDGSQAQSNQEHEYAFQASRRSLLWLLMICAAAYLLCSVNPNKDPRYPVPILPILAVILAYGLALLPRSWRGLQWGTMALISTLAIFRLFPLAPSAQPDFLLQRYPLRSNPPPYTDVMETILQAEPHLKSTIGVLPSTPEINQHTVNFYGLRDRFQIQARQVGTEVSQVERERRSLPWLLTKTGNQGDIRRVEAQTALNQAIETATDMSLHKAWALADGSMLKLFRPKLPAVTVQSIAIPNPVPPAAPVRLEQVTLPRSASASRPIPVTYSWSGSWQALQQGMAILTWKPVGTSSAPGWLHDHAIALGRLHPGSQPPLPEASFRITERLAMLVPNTTPAGTYTLQATYLNRETGRATVIDASSVQLQINPNAPIVTTPEPDLQTQLRALTATLPQGVAAIDGIMREVDRFSRLDPSLDYVKQTAEAAAYRLQQEPKNPSHAYTLGFAHVLSRQVAAARNALQRVVELDSKNPNAYAYLAFVNLYDLRPKAAETALASALKLDPSIPELHGLNGIAALMQGHFQQAWKAIQTYQQRSADRAKTKP